MTARELIAAARARAESEAEPDEVTASRVAAGAWVRAHDLSPGGTCDAAFLAPERYARDIVADLIGAPAIELELSDCDIEEALEPIDLTVRWARPETLPIERAIRNLT